MRAGPDHFGRVRIEGHHHRTQPAITRPLHRMADNFLVAAVYAVKDADGHHRAAAAPGHRLVSPPPLHAYPRCSVPLGRPQRIGRESAPKTLRLALICTLT